MRKVWTYLRMEPLSGSHPIPTSEAVYLEHSNLIDAVMPINGGTLKGDGTWDQLSGRIDSAWAQGLPNLVRSASQLYAPVVDRYEWSEYQAVLDDVALYDVAAQNIVNLALSERWDSPWDAVTLSLDGPPSSYREKLNQFYYTLSYHIRRAGLPVVIATRGRIEDPPRYDYDECYSADFAVIAQCADTVIYSCAGYWGPTQNLQQRSNAPSWWIDESIQHGLDQGIPAQQMIVGQSNLSTFWPESATSAGSVQVKYTDAMQIVANHNAYQQWIERGQYGLVRERFADLGIGHIWIRDGDTQRVTLDLIDKYGALGASLFLPGCGDPYLWDVIGEWRG